MKIFRCALVLLFHLGVDRLHAQPEKKAPREEPLVLGARYQGGVYATVHDKQEESENLRLIHVQKNNDAMHKSIAYGYHREDPLHWRIAFGHLWYVFLEGNNRFEMDGYYRLTMAGLEQGKRCIWPDPEDDQPPFNVLGSLVQCNVGEGPIRGEFGTLAILSEFPFKGHYDYVPLAKDAVRLFALCNTSARLKKNEPQLKGNLQVSSIEGGTRAEKWTFRTMKYKVATIEDQVKKGRLTWGGGTWSDEEFLEVSFKEPFHAYVLKNGNDYNYYFVTESGRLYMYPAPAKKGDQRQAIEVWTDPSQPITHVLDDVDTGRTFCFGKFGDPQSLKEDARFGFVMGFPKVNPDRFPASELKPAAVEEPLKTLLQYAVRQEGRDAERRHANMLYGDKKLRVKVSVADRPLELKDLLPRLEKATGLTLTLDKNLAEHRPLFGELSYKEDEALGVLRMIARTNLTEGRWKKTDTGYLLTATASTSAQVQAEQKTRDEIKAKDKVLNDRFAKEHPLALDPRLQTPLTVMGVDIPLADLLRRLRDHTGLNLVLADNLVGHQPDMGHLQLPGVQPFKLMEIIQRADLQEGSWEKTPSGYRLTGTSLAGGSTKVAEAPVAQESRKSWWMWVGGGVLAATMVGAFWWRRRAMT